MVKCNWPFDKGEPCRKRAEWGFKHAKICEKHYRKVLELNPRMEGRYTRIPEMRGEGGKK